MAAHRAEETDLHAQKERELKKLKSDQDELAGITQQLNQYRSDPLIMLTQRDTVSALEQRATEITNRYGSQSTLDEAVEKLSQQVNDPKLKYLNSPDYRSRYQRLLDLGAGGQSVQNNFAELEDLTPEERGAYNYYYYKHGKEKADAYLSDIRYDLNARRAAEIVEDTTIVDSPILSDILKLKQGYDAGIDTWQQNMRRSGDMLQGNDRYVAPSAQQMASSQIRQQMAQKGLASQMAYDVATGIGQMTPMLYTSAVANTLLPGSGKIVRGGMTFLSSSGGAYQDAINRGYTPDQARGYGILTGASEAGLEYLLDGVTKLGGKVTAPMLEKLSGKVKNVLVKVADTYGGKMLSEFGEEYLQSVLKPVYENLTLGTEQDIDLLSEEALYEACIGAISSGLVEGGVRVGGQIASMDASSAESQSNKPKPRGIRFTLRDVEIPTWEQIVQKPPIPVVDISKPKTTGRFAERRNAIKKSLDSIIAKPYYNSDTGTFIFLTEKSYTHMYSKSRSQANDTNELRELQINAAEHLPELLENAVLTHVEPRDHGNDYAVNMYTFFAAAKAKNVHPVKIKVKEYRYKGQEIPKNIKAFFDKLPRDYTSSYDTKVLSVEEIEESPSGSVKDMSRKDSFLNPDELSEISVPDLLNRVNADYQKEEGLSGSAKAAINDSVAHSPDRPSEITVPDLLGLVNADYQKYVPQIKDANGSENAVPNGKNRRINIVNQIPEEEEEAQRRYSRWLQEAEAAKGLYGDFDQGKELEDPRFRQLLQSGISVPDAYLVTHQAEVFLNAARAGVRIAEERVNRRVEENRRRPRENGLSPGAAFITRPSVSHMTRAQRQSIAHRAQKGEKIIF